MGVGWSGDHGEMGLGFEMGGDGVGKEGWARGEKREELGTGGRGGMLEELAGNGHGVGKWG